jgi:hypothetical protein
VDSAQGGGESVGGAAGGGGGSTVVVGAVVAVVVLVSGVSVRRRSRSSGEAVGSGFTGTPRRLAVINDRKIEAGYDPPVTVRPWTSTMGRRGS